VFAQRLLRGPADREKLRILTLDSPVPTNITSYVLPPGVFICASTAICVKRYLDEDETRKEMKISARQAGWPQKNLLRADARQNWKSKVWRNVLVHQRMGLDEIQGGLGKGARVVVA
jgi:hypothetical protein